MRNVWCCPCRIEPNGADISAQNNTQPHRVYNSMALTKALANDISDGKINGKKGADDIF